MPVEYALLERNIAADLDDCMAMGQISARADKGFDDGAHDAVLPHEYRKEGV